LHATIKNEALHAEDNMSNRRSFLSSVASLSVTLVGMPVISSAEDGLPEPQIQVLPTGDVKKLFNEGRALEAQGNILAAQRLYTKITKVSPGFIYGWSSLGNTLTAQGELNTADEAYTKAVNLCEENLRIAEQSPGTRRCDDLYLLLLNRGSVRLNNNQAKDALADLQRSNALRARPDAIILQNLARAQGKRPDLIHQVLVKMLCALTLFVLHKIELNAQYSLSDKSYTTAISMTANEVNPFWIRSSMVKYQLGDISGAMDLMRRVENRFPEAPEVRAGYAVLLLGRGEEDSARKKFLEIPDRQRMKYSDDNYLNSVVAWPPAMQSGINYLTKAVGDRS
jgi:tetratricopeptide (TPR) repeat protein